MRIDPSLTVAKRPERDFAKLWSLYSPRQDVWLDVVFATEREALVALQVLTPSTATRPKAGSSVKKPSMPVAR